MFIENSKDGDELLVLPKIPVQEKDLQ